MKNAQIIKMFEAKQKRVNRNAENVYFNINKLLRINKPTPEQTKETLVLLKEYDKCVAVREELGVIIRHLKKLDNFDIA